MNLSQGIGFGDNRSKAIAMTEHLSILIMAPMRIDTNTNKTETKTASIIVNNKLNNNNLNQ
jgi:hypothetical protein